MKKIHYLLGIALLFVGMPVSAQVSNDNEDEVYKVARPQAKDFVPGQVLFKLKDGQLAQVRRAGGQATAGISSLDKVLKEYAVQEMEQLLPNAKVKGTPRRAKAYNGQTIVERDLTQLYKVTLPEEKVMQTLQLVDDLKALPEVEFAEPNYKMYIMADDHIADSYDGNPMATKQQQWYLYNYGVTQLWDKPVINPTRPVIAIIDTGVDMTHPDLAPNLWTNTAEAEGEADYDNDGNGYKGDVHGWDFINNTPNVKDFNMHGTHVAGIAAACNNDIGIVGANPKALIMPVSVMQSDGTGDVATIIKGIDYAVASGATVLNLSLGSYANSSALRQSLERAYQKAVIVAAAGNDFARIHREEICPHKEKCGFGVMFPAGYSFVLGVQATAPDGSLASFSNHDYDGPNYSSASTIQDPDGFNYELKAPGTNMLSTIPGGNYKALNGTSMAAPLVAGAISALKMVKDYDTQEILWGDLLHTNNIAEAFSVTARPAELDLMNLQMRDRKDLESQTEEDYSNDHEIDAGELVSVYPVIRTTFGEASNIKLKLVMGDYEDPTTVDIQTDWVDFGMHLDAYGRGVSWNPLVFKVGENVADARHIKLKILATCDETSQTYEWPFTIVVTNMVKINGLISEDMTLTADHTYLVNEGLGVMKGTTLTIEPGTRLEFAENTSLISYGRLVAKGTPEKPIVFARHTGEGSWNGIHTHESTIDNPRDTISYCIIEGYKCDGWIYRPYLKDCVIIPQDRYDNCFYSLDGVRNNISGIPGVYPLAHVSYLTHSLSFSNIVNNDFYDAVNLPYYSQLCNNNYFNNTARCLESGKFFGKEYWISAAFNTPTVDKTEYPSYLGTGREDIVRLMVNSQSFSSVDLSNMPTRPYAEAHGIVWKVVVNGYDAQDEYEQLPPLGVGKHKFQVYFNRPMNKAVAPQISFGVRDPWTQQAVSEDGEGFGWNADGTVYTAYKTIDGKTKSDGVCRIYVHGAQDNEYFEIPYEKTRFNIQVQAAGSMATGFGAEAGLGRVNLKWNNENNNFDDAMGFNIYRYKYVEKTIPAHYDENWNWIEETTALVPDTIRINTDIVDIETTAFTDYDVTPGETYYYLYKVLSTDLQEYDVSNVVAATPLTSELGDANGSGKVDVADVITTVNYAAGLEPKPFIFEAADMNTDKNIDILDVVGIIQKILHPTAAPALAMIEAQAVYTIEDGVLYVESPVALAGVQALVNHPTPNTQHQVSSDLNGFEHVTAWLSDNDMLFLAYNMNGKTLTPGKHALLYIGDADVTQIRLSDTLGHNIDAVAGNTTAIDNMGSKVQLQGGVYNLKGQKVSGKAGDLQKLPKGVYIINGEKVVK